MKKNDYHVEKKHFRNVIYFDINSLTNNLLSHRLDAVVVIETRKK